MNQYTTMKTGIPERKGDSTEGSRLDQALAWVERQTHLRTRHARMLSSGDQGRLLQLISLMVRPRRILELGTFTGYSTLCLSRGLAEDGRIDTVECNDELEELIREGYARAGLLEPGRERVCLWLGDACSLLPGLPGPYDLVYLDADKREYPKYLEQVLPKMVSGGIILADNVLWSGKVLQEEPPKDAQTQAILQFNRCVSSHPELESVLLPIRDGLYLIRKK